MATRSLVIGQMATLFERFPAKALVRLNARARSKVHFQIAFNSKRFSTRAAFERLLARVYARVIFQITLRRKFFITPFTADTSSSFLLILCVDQDLYCLELPNRSYYSFPLLVLELARALNSLLSPSISVTCYSSNSSSAYSSSWPLSVSLIVYLSIYLNARGTLFFLIS